MKNDADRSAKVNVSFRIANFTVFVAVAGDPETFAVTTKSVSGVTAVGIPETSPVELNESPVPVKAGADRITGNPETADAENRIVPG